MRPIKRSALILKRDLALEIVGPPVRLYSNFIRGIRSLPVVIHA